MFYVRTHIYVGVTRIHTRWVTSQNPRIQIAQKGFPSWRFQRKIEDSPTKSPDGNFFFMKTISYTWMHLQCNLLFSLFALSSFYPWESPTLSADVQSVNPTAKNGLKAENFSRFFSGQKNRVNFSSRLFPSSTRTIIVVVDEFNGPRSMDDFSMNEKVQV